MSCGIDAKQRCATDLVAGGGLATDVVSICQMQRLPPTECSFVETFMDRDESPTHIHFGKGVDVDFLVVNESKYLIIFLVPVVRWKPADILKYNS